LDNFSVKRVTSLTFFKSLLFMDAEEKGKGKPQELMF